MPFGPGQPYKIAKVTPYKWPQDNLTIPNGYGTMPPVEYQNITAVRREAFVYSAAITQLASGASAQVIIPTDDDGDFW